MLWKTGASSLLFGLLASVVSAQVVVTGSFDADEIATIEFVSSAITSPLYLDITTNGSLNPDTTAADTEIGLYVGTGPGATFAVTDDDDGIGLTSTLSFGAGSGLLLGDSFNLGGDGLANGEDGDLGGGAYTLVIGEFNTIFPDPGTLGEVVDVGDEGVDYTVTFYTNDPEFSIVPEPASLTMLLCSVAGLALLRRRG